MNVPPPVVLTAGRICDLVGGELLGRGGGTTDVARTFTGVAPLDTATASDISFMISRRYLNDLSNSRAGGVLIGSEFRDAPGESIRIVVENPQIAMAQVLAMMYPKPDPMWGLAASARIGRGVKWSGRISLGAGSRLAEDVTLGADCVIEPHAIVGPGAVLGDRCVIGAAALITGGAELGDDVVVKPGARVGTDGFGYVPRGGPGADAHATIRHAGGCRIGRGVHIGANTCIDRGSVGDTIIGAETKIDNLVQVGHNSRIGSRCFVMAQVGMAGSSVVEDDVILAGQVGLAGHLTVGAGARVAAQGGVIGDVPARATVSDFPARSHQRVLRQAAALRRLTPLARKLEMLVERDGNL